MVRATAHSRTSKILSSSNGGRSHRGRQDLKIALKSELEKLFTECKRNPTGAPLDLQNNYKLYLNSSGKDQIVGVLQAAIRNMDESRLVGIDLNAPGGWWSTRLLLLAGLLADYTAVDKLVFSAGERYLGTCAPSETRRALAKHFIEVERAFAAALPGQPSFDPVQDISGIVTRFQERLDGLGGEAAIKQMVEPHVVRIVSRVRRQPSAVSRWAGSDRASPPASSTSRACTSASRCTNGHVMIVDCMALACRIAQLGVDRV